VNVTILIISKQRRYPVAPKMADAKEFAVYEAPLPDPKGQ
jgi:hypothetical protein